MGQTVQDLKERWYGHCRAVSNCTAIARAMKKHGKVNFTIYEVLKKRRKTVSGFSFIYAGEI